MRNFEWTEEENWDSDSLLWVEIELIYCFSGYELIHTKQVSFQSKLYSIDMIKILDMS